MMTRRCCAAWHPNFCSFVVICGVSAVVFHTSWSSHSVMSFFLQLQCLVHFCVCLFVSCYLSKEWNLLLFQSNGQATHGKMSHASSREWGVRQDDIIWAHSKTGSRDCSSQDHGGWNEDQPGWCVSTVLFLNYGKGSWYGVCWIAAVFSFIEATVYKLPCSDNRWWKGVVLLKALLPFDSFEQEECIFVQTLRALAIVGDIFDERWFTWFWASVKQHYLLWTPAVITSANYV